MRKKAAIIIGKAIGRLNKISGSGGTALPGLVADKISPDLLKHYIAQNFPDGVILVTGTNGKTTTARILANIFDEAGISYVHNSTGSNLIRGILSTLIASSDINGRTVAKIAILEVDEATVADVIAICQPRLIIVTNLFRDQLDRFGEIDTLAKRLKAQLEKVNGKLILNADDPIVTGLSIGMPNERLCFFGVDDYPVKKLAHDYSLDMATSPLSDSPLVYSDRYIGHIGKYKSANNDFKRPKPAYNVVKITTKSVDQTDFCVKHNKTQTNYSLDFGGLYNIYNALSAIAAGNELGIKSDIIKSALKKSKAAFGRVETVEYHKRFLQLLLIKNPTGFNQVIQSFLLSSQKLPVLVLINDNFADGRDVSWLWDAAIEDLKNYKGPISTGGIRAYDMALRLKYADITPAHVETDIGQAVEQIVRNSKNGQKILILPTYTAMLEARKYLVKRAKIKEFWQ